MSRNATFILFYLAVFLQAGAYGLTFLLPDLFQEFGANAKLVGQMLFLTTLATLMTVYFSGHISDRFGRMPTLGLACLTIAAALMFFALADGPGALLVAASLALGAGWGLTYALAPVVMAGLVTADMRVRCFALLSMAVMAGFGSSPVLAAWLLEIGLGIAAAFHIVAIMCALAGGLFFVLAGSVRAHQLDTATDNRSRLTPGNMRAILKSPAWLPVVMVALGASVFAGMTNFQTVLAGDRGLDYAVYFTIYTVTVVVFRIVLSRFAGGPNAYATIAMLQYVMAGSVVLFMISGNSVPLYWLVAFLFGIGYGVSYPILAAMAANDADADLVPQTLQLFALTYFIGIFGFPLIAGWLLVELGPVTLLTVTAILAVVEASMAGLRALAGRHRTRDA